MTPDEELESRANADVLEPDHPCRNCGHEQDAHGIFENHPQCFMDEFGGYACPCPCFEPATRDDLEEESE